MDRPPSSFIDLNEDQPQEDHLFNLNNDQISPTLTLSSYPPQDQGEFFYRSQPQRYQLQSPLITNNKADHKIVSCDLNHPRAEESESENNNDLNLSITWKKSDHVVKEATHTHNKYMDDSVKWTSSKMRMMRKMIITNNHHPDHHHHHHTITNDIDHHHHHHHDAPVHFTHHHHKLDHHHHHQIILKNNNHNNKNTPKSPFGADHHSPSSSSNNIINNNNVTIRVCSDCNTTKTPLWRSGPRGPKSLCNACGIRQRKARRAMAAAAAAANGTIVTVDTASMKNTASKIQHNKEKKLKLGANCGNIPQFKNKRSNANTNNNKLSSSSSSSLPSSKGKKNKLLCFEDLRISINKNSAFQRVFPQDEKDAAILLMALSYGLVHG